MGIDCLDKTAAAAKPNPLRKTYKCNVDECGKSFLRQQHLRKHIETHSKGMVRKSRKELAIGTTDECDKTLTRKSLDTNHNDNSIQVNTGQKQYKCEEPNCNAVFGHRHRLQKHKLVYHCRERPFKCDFQGCEKSYVNGAHLKRHKDTSHSTKEVASQQVVCKVNGCGNVYCNKYVLKQHIAAAHIENEDTVKANGTKKKCDIEKKHRCDEPGCEAAFSRPYRLKNHKLTVHGGERPFQCNYEGCDKSYTNESHLARHKNISHSPEEIDTTKEVLCEEGCGRIFSNKYNLKKHLAVCHTDLPFPCQECDEKFKRKSHLHAHMVEAHEKEAPYKCSICPRVFIQWNLYHKHLKNHKTYECDCKGTFDKWSKLLKHRKTECTVKVAPHKCTICDKTFVSKHTLREHSLGVHIPDSQIDLLKCPYLNCTHSYKYKNNLTWHIRTYHEKLFKTIRCPEKNCEVVLKSNRNLKQHLRIVHHGLPAKIRKPRRPRKDTGIPKTSMASVISGFEVSAVENEKNISEKMDENLKEEASVRVACCENDNKVVSKNRKVKINHESLQDERICKRKRPSNAKNKQAECSTQNKSLIGCQETTLDVVKSLPLAKNIKNTDEIFENCLDTTSLSVISIDLVDECGENPIQNNSETTTSLSVISMDLVDECGENPIQNNSENTTSLSVISMDLVDKCGENPIQNNSENTTSLSVISMDLVDECGENPIQNNSENTTSLSVISMDLVDECAENPIQNNSKNIPSLPIISMDLADECAGNPIQNNSETQPTKQIKIFKNTSKEINAENELDITGLLSNLGENIMDISEPLNNPDIIEMASVQLGKLQNDELNTVEKVLQSKLKIVESFQSIVGGSSCVVSENTLTTTEMQQDLLRLDTDTVSGGDFGQNSCNSEVIIFDFFEFDNIDHSKNMQTLTNLSKESDVDSSMPVNFGGSSDDNYISDEEKLRKRLGVMLNDISAVLKHL